MPDHPQLSIDTISALVRRVDPDAVGHEAASATEGYHLVYRLEVDLAGERQAVMLKATPPSHDGSCGDEARLLAILDTHTDLPLPAVLGLVDRHEDHPAP